jgi:hypothetical protein
LHASRPGGIRNRQSRPDAAPRAARLTLATKAHMAPARAATSTRPATPGPRCRNRYAVSRLRWGALRGVDACRHAGPTVPQSSIVGSTDDCHISPPIAKPEAARDRRADRLPDDVAAHHEAVLEAWFGVSDDRSRRRTVIRGHRGIRTLEKSLMTLRAARPSDCISVQVRNAERQ